MNLENLKVQPSSLDFLHLPITVKFGSVGRLHLKANWAKLSSVPVQVVLERVFLVAGPKTEVRLDEVRAIDSVIDWCCARVTLQLMGVVT